jgi:hypothetical protein
VDEGAVKSEDAQVGEDTKVCLKSSRNEGSLKKGVASMASQADESIGSGTEATGPYSVDSSKMGM